MALVQIATVLLMACASAAGANPLDQTKSGQFKFIDMGEFVVKAGAVTFNNFCLRELANDDVPAGVRDLRGFGAVTVRGTFRNPTGERLAYTLVVCGLNAAGETEWACNLAGVAEPEDVGVFDGQVSVQPSTLKLTPTVKVRVRVGPVPERKQTLPPALVPSAHYPTRR